MAIKLGIAGKANTGKSYSRSFIKDPESVFIIYPSVKAQYLTGKDGKPLPYLNISTDKNKTTEDVMAATNASSPANLLRGLTDLDAKTFASKFKVEGNHFLCIHIEDIEKICGFISKHMPHIKTIIIPDFTHFISRVVASREFRARNSKGEAFARFWDLAAETLNAFFINIDLLRRDLIVVTEFHAEYDVVANEYEIFVPAGKMLKEKFLPDSYFDTLLYTKFIRESDDGSLKTEDRYRFVTQKTEEYNARCVDNILASEIPNNLEDVLTKMREYYGI